MTLMNLAEKGRSQKDPLLKMPTAILILDGLITEKRDVIREQSIIEIDDDRVPKVLGFQDEALVEKTQQEIAVLGNNKEQLQAIVDEAEAVFASSGLQAMSMMGLDEKINEAQSRSETVARRINRLAVRLLNDNPALTLVQLFANEELLALEGSRGVAISEGLLEAQRLIKLKDQLLPLCGDGSVIAEAVFHPMRSDVSDPARISELRSA
ncbi:MAG: hypothetical protein ACYDHX_12740 [Methanothrix sp.]